MHRIDTAIFFGTVFFCTAALQAQPYGCDSTDVCTGNALTLNGVNQYVDIPNNAVFASIDSLGALTVEMWMNATRQPGMVQIVGGNWGPRTSRDDEWLLLIDQTDTLRFMVSDGAANAGTPGNTVASWSIAGNYSVWTHVAATWSSATKSVSLYVNGIRADSVYNKEYPAVSLRNTSLPFFQIGSFNGFLNAPANYRTYSGQLDEIRIWNVARPADSLQCSLYHHFTGAEPGLIAYYRCNGGVYPDSLCDASVYGNSGALRNNADVTPSMRTIPQFLISSVDTIKFSLFCSSDTTFTFSITDTSVCGDVIQLSASAGSGITITPATATMDRNVPQQFTFSVTTQSLGLLNDTINITAAGSCSPMLLVPVIIQRATPLTLSLGRIDYDTLRGCQQSLFEDSIFQICNSSMAPIAIESITKNSSAFDTAFIGGWSPPDTLQPGACVSLSIRFHSAVDSTYIDTLHIISRDSCPGSGTIVLTGTMEDYLNTVDSVNFGNVFLCSANAYAGELVKITNDAVQSQTLVVTNIQSQSGVFASSAVLPMKIQGGANQQILITLQTGATGFYSDSVVITANVGGCTLSHTIYVSANVLQINLGVAPDSLNFGNVFIGTSSVSSVTVTNNGVTQAGTYSFLDSGKVFTITSSDNLYLPSGANGTVTVTFTPSGPGIFYDTLLVQDTTCHNIIKVPLQGTGVLGPVAVYPESIEYGEVFNCLCGYDTVTITNSSGGALTIKAAAANGAGFSFAPQPPANQTISPGDSMKFAVEFCGAGVAANGGYTGTAVFTTDNPAMPVVTVRLAATRTTVIFDAPPVTPFGSVEINTTYDIPITIQNASVAAVCIDSITAPPGYTVISTVPALPDSLGSTRVIIVTVRFSPKAQIAYNGQLYLHVSCPCIETDSIAVTGSGVILDITFPWTTIVLPQTTLCDTAYRDVALQNQSHHQITINSITVTGADSSAFSWQGLNFVGLPTVIDSLTTDSVRFYFYPRLASAAFANATLTIITTTASGTDTSIVTLSGSLQQEYTTSDTALDFGAIAVRSAAATQFLYLYDAFVGTPIVIDSITLLDNAGVFRITVPALPVTLAPGDSLTVGVDFTPLAAVQYSSLIAVHVSSPCPAWDSTFAVRGSGFTPVALIEMCVDSIGAASIGDTFSLSIIASELVPQTPVNVNLIVNYDVNAVYLQSAQADSCASVKITYTATGAIVSLTTCKNLDSGAIGMLTFRALVPDSLVATISIDSIAFAADTALLQSLIGQGCGTTVTLNGHCFLTSLIQTDTVSALSQNAPNPVSGLTTITYSITENTPVLLRVFDMLGRVVAVPVDAFEMNGAHSCTFDARYLQPGVYYYSLDAGVFHAARMLSVVR